MMSLRSRLIVVLLPPLVALALGLGAWRAHEARATAETVFDRALLTAALAVSRDVFVAGGDAVQPETLALIREAAEDDVFYHVHGPDGVFVTGFATPPVPPAGQFATDKPVFFDAVYRNENVRAVRLREMTRMDNISGFSTVTVWQTKGSREALARAIVFRSFGVMGLMIAATVAVVWFGVDRGLRPLTELRDAISRRSAKDLSPISRPMPEELGGIVRTFNRLLEQLSDAFATRDRFLADAAHQLRNPVAAVLSTAEALEGQSDPDERARREADLLAAARHASRLTRQLLTYERLTGHRAQASEVELGALVRRVVERKAPAALHAGIDLGLEMGAEPVLITADATDLEEALDNLIDNALTHGGPALSRIDVRLEGRRLVVEDDGPGLPMALRAQALERFVQLGAVGQGGGQRSAGGSGLGLPIARQAVERNGGTLGLSRATLGGLCAEIRF